MSKGSEFSSVSKGEEDSFSSENETLLLKVEPWYAVFLSAIFPGLGQWYAGSFRSEAGFFKLALVLLFGVFAAFLAPGVDGFWLLLPLVLWSLFATFSLFHAFKTAKKYNSEESELQRKNAKDPWLACFLTYFGPGLGHLYLGKGFQGILFLVISFGLVFYLKVHLLLYLVYIIGVSFFIYQQMPTERKLSSKHFGGLFGIECSKSLLLLLFTTFIFEGLSVKGQSMTPTIASGDLVFMNKFSYYFQEPEKGDIVAFIVPEGSTKLLKRIEATPQTAKDSQNPLLVEGKPITLNPDQVYVLGDNLDNSRDSRAFGPIPTKSIESKVFKKIPFSRFLHPKT